MIKQLTQRSTLVSPSSLASVHSVERLVQEESNRPAGVHPWGTVLVQGRCVPKQGEEVDYDEAKAGERYLAHTD